MKNKPEVRSTGYNEIEARIELNEGKREFDVPINLKIPGDKKEIRVKVNLHIVIKK
jgi:hypothetical protein